MLKFHESSFLARMSVCRATSLFSLPRAYPIGRPAVSCRVSCRSPNSTGPTHTTCCGHPREDVTRKMLQWNFSVTLQSSNVKMTHCTARLKDLTIILPERDAKYCSQRICMSVSMHVRVHICPLTYLKNHKSAFYEIFCTCGRVSIIL